jgi:hypothetical protein
MNADELYIYIEEHLFPLIPEDHPFRFYAMNIYGKSQDELDTIKASVDRYINEHQGN